MIVSLGICAAAVKRSMGWFGGQLPAKSQPTHAQIDAANGRLQQELGELHQCVWLLGSNLPDDHRLTLLKCVELSADTVSGLLVEQDKSDPQD